jgi:hypothetical protein
LSTSTKTSSNFLGIREIPSILFHASSCLIFLHIFQIDWLNKILHDMWPYLDKVHFFPLILLMVIVVLHRYAYLIRVGIIPYWALTSSWWSVLKVLYIIWSFLFVRLFHWRCLGVARNQTILPLSDSYMKLF